MKIFLILFFLIFVSCSEQYQESTEMCTDYSDLCGCNSDPGMCTKSMLNKSYKICVDEAGSWFEVNGIKYYTSEYLMAQECGY